MDRWKIRKKERKKESKKERIQGKKRGKEKELYGQRIEKLFKKEKERNMHQI